MLSNSSINISFALPNWLVIHYHVIGTISLLLNSATIYLVIFKSDKIDNFRYFILLFQLLCTLTDFHLTTLMQPIPLFPIMAGYCNGLLARVFDVWSHYLMAFMVSIMAAQVECLMFCFMKKHQTIASIMNRHVIPQSMFSIISGLLPFAAVACFIIYCNAGGDRDKQMEFVEKNHFQYLAEFSSLPNFAIYSLNFWFISIAIVAIIGGTFGGMTFVFSTIDMFKMLRAAQRKISRTNFKRHQSAVKSLLAQFATTGLCLGPPLLFVVVIMTKFRYAQITVEILLSLFATHSTVNAMVLVATTPPYRNFVMRCNLLHHVKLPQSQPAFHSFIATTQMSISQIDFSTPNWLVSYFYVIAAVSFVLNFFGILLLISEGSKLGSFRYHLLVFQIVCTLSDIHLTVLTQPVPLAPLLAGYTLGVLSKQFDVSAHYCTLITGCIALIQLEGLIVCFAKKHQAIANVLNVRKIPKAFEVFCYILCVVGPICFFIVMELQRLTDSEQWDYIGKNFPELLPKFHSLSHFVIHIKSPNCNSLFIAVFMGGLTLMLIFLLLTFDIFRLMVDLKIRRSSSLYQKHREAVHSLMVQLATSSLCFIPPCALVLIVFVEIEHAQFWSELCIVCFASHSSISMVCLLLFFPPYQRFFGRVSRLNKPKHVPVAVIAAGSSIS